jgi:hypothetical protein
MQDEKKESYETKKDATKNDFDEGRRKREGRDIEIICERLLDFE